MERLHAMERLYAKLNTNYKQLPEPNIRHLPPKSPKSGGLYEFIPPKVGG